VCRAAKEKRDIFRQPKGGGREMAAPRHHIIPSCLWCGIILRFFISFIMARFHRSDDKNRYQCLMESVVKRPSDKKKLLKNGTKHFN
jgi:hypothetical protein